MATTRTIDGIDFEIPDGQYTGKDLQEQAGADRSAVPTVRRQDKDIIVEPNEVIDVQSGDRVVFSSPMEAA